MANEVAKVESGAVAVRAGNRLAALYALIDNDDGYGPDALPVPLSANDRHLIQDYRRDLHARLRPISDAMAERDKAQAAIAIFLGGYLNAKTSDPKGTSAVYVMQVMDQPLFAIMEALDDFRNGRVFDIGKEGEKIPFTIDHAPSAPRLLDQVKKRSADTFEERFKCDRLLRITKTSPPPVSEAERERVGVLLKNLAGNMGMQNALDRKKSLEKTRAEADEARSRAQRIISDAQARRVAADRASQDQAAAEAHG